MSRRTFTVHDASACAVDGFAPLFCGVVYEVRGDRRHIVDTTEGGSEAECAGWVAEQYPDAERVPEKREWWLP
jgi:hypothetical protein